MTLSGRIIEQRIGAGFMAEVGDQEGNFVAQNEWSDKPVTARKTMEAIIGVPIKWELNLYDISDNITGKLEWKGDESCVITRNP